MGASQAVMKNNDKNILIIVIVQPLIFGHSQAISSPSIAPVQCTLFQLSK